MYQLINELLAMSEPWTEYGIDIPDAYFIEIAHRPEATELLKRIAEEGETPIRTFSSDKTTGAKLSRSHYANTTQSFSIYYYVHTNQTHWIIYQSHS